MQSVLVYMRAFIEDHGVRFVDVDKMHIVEDMVLLNVLAVSSRATYRRDSIAGKMMIEYQGVFSLLAKLDREAPATKTLVSRTLLYILSGEDFILMNQVAEAFMKNNYKPASLPTNPFRRHSRALLD